jgi:hypothetical protein
MFQIRTAQLSAFQDEFERAFPARVVEHLRKHHAQAIAGLGGEPLRALVSERIRRARSYGLTWESTIAAFVAMTFAIAPEFDRHPSIRRILHDEKIPPNSRLEGLLEQLTESEWAEAARLSAATA